AEIIIRVTGLGPALMGSLDQVFVWVDRRTAQADFVVHMRSGSATRTARQSNHLISADFFTWHDQKLSKMRVIGLQPVAVIHHEQLTVGTRPRRTNDYAISCHVNRCASRCSQIDTGVERAFPRERVRPAPERTS